MSFRKAVTLLPSRREVRRGFTRAAVFAAMLIAAVVALQDVLVFPGVVLSKLSRAPVPPPGVTAFTLPSSDGVTVALWSLPAAEGSLAPGESAAPALFVHGNGGSMSVFFPIQRWLSRLGLNTYAIDTRGFGASTGWPSEAGIDRDVEEAVREIARREQVRPRDVVIVGLSVGSGPAAHTAATFGARELVLLAPYSSLRLRVSEDPLFGFLSPLLWYDFPTADDVSKLGATCLVVAHGMHDTIINHHHSDAVVAAYHGAVPPRSVRIADAGHNDLIVRGGAAIGAAIRDCIAASAPLPGEVKAHNG